MVVRGKIQSFNEWHRRALERQFLPLVLVLLVAIAIRILMTLGTNGILWPDSAAYYRSAALMAKYANFYWHEIYRTPLYPIFMAPFLWIFGQTELAGDLIIAAQRMLGVGTVGLLYLVARRSFGPIVAFYGSILYAGHTLQLYYETAVHTETLFTFLLIVTVFCCQRFFERPTLGQAALIGFLCAITTLTRPIAQFLVLIVLMVLLFKGGMTRRWWLIAVVSVGTCFATLLPWMVTNKVYYRFFGISQDLGLNLFHRIIDVERIAPREDTAYPRVLRIWKAVKHKRYSSYFLVYHGMLRERVKALEADRMMVKFSLETLSQDSWRYLPQYLKNSVSTFYRQLFDVRKSVQFCGAEEGPYMCTRNTLGRSEKAFTNTDAGLSPPYRMAVRAYFRYFELPMGFLAALAMVGFALGCSRLRRADPVVLLMCAITLYFAAITAIFNIPEDRFRLPADGFILMAAVFVVYAVFSKKSVAQSELFENTIDS